MYSQAPAHQFPGLDLVTSADEAGCIDLLNVDFDRVGAIRTRDGYDNFTSSPAGVSYERMFPFYTGSGTRRLIASRTTTLEVLSTSGTSVSTQTITGSRWAEGMTAVRFGTPSSELLYVAIAPTASSATFYKWFETGWSTVTGPAWVQLVGVQQSDNRLVLVTGSGFNRVHFSNPGVPETFDANDYVDLTPGDGEGIVALVNYNNEMFAFKASKFFRFYGNSTDSDGVTEFNYQAIYSGVGPVSPQQVVSSPDGIYFVARDGIYLTTGGVPTRITDQVEAIWSGNTSSFFASSAMNLSKFASVALTYMNGRLYMAFASGSSSSNDRMLVFDTKTETWTLWSIAAWDMVPFRVGDKDELMFVYAAGGNHIGRHSSAYTTDDGSAISWRYRTGFTDFGNDLEKEIDKTRLFGSGTVDVKWSRDFGDLGSAKTATLGANPAIGQAVVDCNTPKGRVHSWQFSGTGVARVYRAHHEMSGPGQPDTRTS